ncbi:epoxyqueuosine reductase QueH [uncultured Vagococcus sp.]|uniref:epoxyqueuosine reductase QueH n=1 Tax=uncultured Vagococcus sp. TaxID=189676 RepID=UPI0028D18A38|nr:epoxyqueuosine reductase QueH [uncultured Vagococcus sp.]
MKNAQDILEKLPQNQKVNYDRVLQKVMADWQEREERPSILLHSCCAPCSTYSLEYLVAHAEVSILFANSNIHPESEYRRREKVQQDFVTEFNKRNGTNVKFISSPYEPKDFMRIVGKNKLQNEPEGGKRCHACFQMRLDIVAEQALALGYDYFGSALTVSPHKNSQLINEIGLDIQKIYDVNYLPSDFKKNNGYKRSVELCGDYDIYRQCYCGCVFAAKEQGVDLKQVEQEATFFLEG